MKIIQIDKLLSNGIISYMPEEAITFLKENDYLDYYLYCVESSYKQTNSIRLCSELRMKSNESELQEEIIKILRNKYSVLSEIFVWGDTKANWYSLNIKYYTYLRNHS